MLSWGMNDPVVAQSPGCAREIYDAALEAHARGQTEICGAQDPLYQRVLLAFLDPDTEFAAGEAGQMLDGEFEARAADLVDEAIALAVERPEDLVRGVGNHPLAVIGLGFRGTLDCDPSVLQEDGTLYFGESPNAIHAALIAMVGRFGAKVAVSGALVGHDCAQMAPVAEVRGAMQQLALKAMVRASAEVIPYLGVDSPCLPNRAKRAHRHRRFTTEWFLPFVVVCEPGVARIVELQFEPDEAAESVAVQGLLAAVETVIREQLKAGRADLSVDKGVVYLASPANKLHGEPEDMQEA